MPAALRCCSGDVLEPARRPGHNRKDTTTDEETVRRIVREELGRLLSDPPRELVERITRDAEVLMFQAFGSAVDQAILGGVSYEGVPRCAHGDTSKSET